MKPKKDLKFLTKSLIAHRGMHDMSNNVPENSLLAFKEAIKYGYIIELDIHLLSDKNVVVFHDDNLKRMTGIDKKIKDTTYSEIKDLRLLGTNETIPLLEEVLDLVDGRVPLIIELKYDTKCGQLESAVMNILNSYNGKYAVKSFNPMSVYYFKKNYPSVIRGQLSSNFVREDMNVSQKFILKNMLFNFLTKPDFISYDIDSLPSKVVARYRNKKLVLGWTIKNKQQLKKARKFCDNYICENLHNLVD